MQTSFVCQENKNRVIYTRYYVENFKVFAVLSHYIQRIGRSAEQGKEEANKASELKIRVKTDDHTRIFQKLENPTKRAAASTLLTNTLALASALFGNCLHVYHSP